MMMMMNDNTNYDDYYCSDSHHLIASYDIHDRHRW
jgi:hypothetical protein